MSLGETEKQNRDGWNSRKLEALLIEENKRTHGQLLF